MHEELIDITQVCDDVYRFASPLGDRIVCQFVLVGDTVVLVDSGYVGLPENVLRNGLRSIGMELSAISLVVITHADGDHIGGNAELRAAAPDALLTCGSNDRHLVENPVDLVALRYDAYRALHELSYPDDVLDDALRLSGPPQLVDIAWTGGEILRIRPDWELQIVATPGHSRGHIAVHDLRHNRLYSGDAIHGAGYPDAGGGIAMPPNYIDVAEYLDTIETIRSLALDGVHGGHWPALEGAEVDAFLSASEEFVSRTRSATRAFLRHARRGVTLADVIRGVGLAMTRRTGNDPMGLVYALEAHMTEMVAGGSVDIEPSVSGPVTYVWKGEGAT